MKNLDRLDWAGGVAFSSYGCTVGIRINDLAALPRLEKLLPRGWKPAAEPVERLYSLRVAPEGQSRKVHILNADDSLIVRHKNLDQVLHALDCDIQLHVAERASGKIFVHAGVVAWKGRAIVIPGLSFSGKSMLVRELVRAGAVYYSDEFAVFDEQGRVHPYAKPISIRESDEGAPTDYPIESFGARAGSDPVPVGLILSTAYRTGGSWKARLLSPGQGAIELLLNTVAVRRQPEKTLSALRAAVAEAAVVKGSRGEARAAAPSILGLAEKGLTAPELADLLRRESQAIRVRETTERKRPPAVAGSRILRDGIKPGTPAPAFRLPNVHGGEVALDRYRGRYVLLVFTSPNCGPCDAVAPKLARLHAKCEGKGVSIVMVARGEMEENRLKAGKYNLRFPIALQEKWKLSKEYGIFSTPVAFLIGRTGIVERDVAVGGEAILALAREGMAAAKQDARRPAPLAAGILHQPAGYSMQGIGG